jgi:lipoprotein-releasing system permease protein
MKIAWWGYPHVRADRRRSSCCFEAATPRPLMNGFRQELLSKNLALSGHLLIRPAQYPLKDWQAVADRIGQVDRVRFAAPIVDSEALASSPCRTQSFIRSCGARRATPTTEACRHRRQQNAAG